MGLGLVVEGMVDDRAAEEVTDIRADEEAV